MDNNLSKNRSVFGFIHREKVSIFMNVLRDVLNFHFLEIPPSISFLSKDDKKELQHTIFQNSDGRMYTNLYPNYQVLYKLFWDVFVFKIHISINFKRTQDNLLALHQKDGLFHWEQESKDLSSQGFVNCFINRFLFYLPLYV